ncbi:BTAD domain-containing putative transcriptional regulator [Schinkia azotoformans]|uniref:bacterial transcriptional activator domain-containing protein n=1 Tax=Schinkia azotoformans TaxID=1454 RepID=UPI002E21DB26|nr:BTAD domain-containing putative transcriptional regulator [Schinkia azotoformans]
MKKHLKLYFTENLDELLNYLHGRIEHFGITGNSVELTRTLCQFGCYNLLISNHHTVDVIYKFIKKEYEMNSLGERERASATRFLALYSVFEGYTKEALQYYKESQQLFWSLDLFEEEFMMLTEAYSWLYIWMNNQEEMHYCLQRMKYIQDTIKPPIEFINTIEHPPITRKLDIEYYYRYIIKKNWKINEKYVNSKNRIHLIYMIPALCMKLMNADHDQEMLQQTAFTLLANVNQFKHPFYKAYIYFIVGNALRDNSYILKAKELFLLNDVTDMAELCDAEKNIFSKVKKRSSKLTFKLFGNFEVYIGEKQITLTKWERKKAEELLLYLLVQPNLQALKDVIMDKFYADENYKKASNRIYVLIHTINNKIKNVIENDKPFISIMNGFIRIDHNQIEEIDVLNYLKLLSVGRLLWSDDQMAAIELFNKARKIYHNQVIPDMYYISWLEQFREDIKQKHTKMLNFLLKNTTNAEMINSLFVELIDCDPLNETSVKNYIAYLLGQSHYIKAKEIFQRYARTLKEELGLDVSAELKSLMDVVK